MQARKMNKSTVHNTYIAGSAIAIIVKMCIYEQF